MAKTAENLKKAGNMRIVLDVLAIIVFGLWAFTVVSAKDGGLEARLTGHGVDYLGNNVTIAALLVQRGAQGTSDGIIGSAHGESVAPRNFQGDVVELVMPHDDRDYYCVNVLLDDGTHWFWFVKDLPTGDKLYSDQSDDLSCDGWPIIPDFAFQPLTQGNFRTNR